MNAVKAIYHHGKIEMFEKPFFQKPVEVLIIFPKPEKRIMKLRGLCQNAVIDYNQLEDDLNAASHQCEEHLLQEWSGGEA